MCHSDSAGRAPETRGRGTGEGAYSSFADFSLSCLGEGLGLKKGEGEIGTSPVPRPLLDPKGKNTAPFDRTYVKPGEKPWHLLDKTRVRAVATEYPARFLSKGERQAAARDPKLVWDEASRSYRRRVAATPPPPLATGDGVEGEGCQKSSPIPPSQTGDGLEYERKAHFHKPCGGSDDR